MSIVNWFRRRYRLQLAPPGTAEQGQTADECTETSFDIAFRIEAFKFRLSHSSDIVYHTFTLPSGLSCALIYVRGMIDLKSIEENVLRVLAGLDSRMAAEAIAARLFETHLLPIAMQTVILALAAAELSILDGNVLLLVDGERRMLSLSASSYQKRSIDEAPNEAVIRGPREAFIEHLETNLTLLRRRLKTSRFAVEFMHFGKETQTAVAIAYLSGICKPELVDEMKKRLSSVVIDGVLGSSYLEEFIEDDPYSPFPQMQYSERPDVVCAALLEGRIALIVDGTPIAILAPVTMFMLMQSAEDYYQRYIAASWIRLIRYLFLLISLLLPSFYIAVTTFHPDIIPERLLMTVAAARENVPFPALLEAFLMEISFEALREASLRIPKAIGQAVSIIGALIIGTAAVQAGIASAAMVIIVSMTGIASFIIPHYDLGLAFRLLRFPIMLLAGVFGLFGVACGMILIYFHLIELRSFGLPYMEPLTPRNAGDLKDVFVRAPWWAMRSLPSFSGAYVKGARTKKRKWTPPEQEE